MTTDNPYLPPRAAVADVDDAATTFQPVRFFSSKGRIGRLRYAAYITGVSLLLGFLSAIATAVLGPAAGNAISLVSNIPLVIFVFLAMIQRGHDMNWSGWTCIFGLIPLVALIWLFKSGTPGENRFGAPPPPNTFGVKVLGFLLPVIAMIGILAAIAIPAYQTYVKRAQATQQSH